MAQVASQNTCSKCNQALPQKHFMTCSVCKIKLHLETCSIVTERHYAYLSPKSRTDWKCGSCIWKKANVTSSTTPVRPVGPQTIGRTPTDSNNNNSQRNLNATFTSTTRKNMIQTSSPLPVVKPPIIQEQDKQTAAKKKVVTNVTILSELVSFRDQVSNYFISQDVKFNDLATTLNDFKTCLTELNTKYITLRTDVDNICESLDVANDKHELLMNTVESARLQSQQLQSEKNTLHEELAAAHVGLTSLEQNLVSSESNRSGNNKIEIEHTRAFDELTVTHAQIHTPPEQVPAITLAEPKTMRQNDHTRDKLTKSVISASPSSSAVIIPSTIDNVDPQNSDPSNDAPWQMVHHRRKFKRQGVVVGNAQQQPQLQAMERTRKIHACFLQPDTTVDAMRSHMEEISKKTGFYAAKLKLKHDYYASFVLTVPECTFDLLMTPDSWPAGIEVCEWFHRGARREHYSRPLTPGQRNQETGDANPRVPSKKCSI